MWNSQKNGGTSSCQRIELVLEQSEGRVTGTVKRTDLVQEQSENRIRTASSKELGTETFREIYSIRLVCLFVRHTGTIREYVCLSVILKQSKNIVLCICTHRTATENAVLECSL